MRGWNGAIDCRLNKRREENKLQKSAVRKEKESAGLDESAAQQCTGSQLLDTWRQQVLAAASGAIIPNWVNFNDREVGRKENHQEDAKRRIDARQERYICTSRGCRFCRRTSSPRSVAERDRVVTGAARLAIGTADRAAATARESIAISFFSLPSFKNAFRSNQDSRRRSAGIKGGREQ